MGGGFDGAFIPGEEHLQAFVGREVPVDVGGTKTADDAVHEESGADADVVAFGETVDGYLDVLVGLEEELVG